MRACTPQPWQVLATGSLTSDEVGVPVEVALEVDCTLAEPPGAACA